MAGMEDEINDILSDEVIDVKTDEVVEPTVVAPAEPSSTEPVKPAGGEGDGDKGIVNQEPVVPVVTTPVAGEGVVTPPTTETTVDPKDAQIAALLEQVERLSGGRGKEITTPTTPVTPIVPTAPVETTTMAGFDKLLEEVDFDSIMESKEAFVKFMKDSFTAVREDAVQRTLQAMPEVVGSFVNRQASLRDVAVEFYKTYPELKRVKQYVTHTANEISAANPTWDLATVLKEAATQVKTALQLKDEVETVARAQTAKPALPGGSQVSKVPMKPSTGLQSEIDDLLND